MSCSAGSRSILRRIDVLATTGAAVDAANRLVNQLPHRGQAEQRRAREAVRRLR